MKLTPQKLERWGYRMVKIHNPNFNPFDRSTRVTDRQTGDSIGLWRAKHNRPMHCMYAVAC